MKKLILAISLLSSYASASTVDLSVERAKALGACSGILDWGYGEAKVSVDEKMTPIFENIMNSSLKNGNINTDFDVFSLGLTFGRESVFTREAIKKLQDSGIDWETATRIVAYEKKCLDL